jgi:hypothetical protein
MRIRAVADRKLQADSFRKPDFTALKVLSFVAGGMYNFMLFSKQVLILLLILSNSWCYKCAASIINPYFNFLTYFYFTVSGMCVAEDSYG